MFLIDYTVALIDWLSYKYYPQKSNNQQINRKTNKTMSDRKRKAISLEDKFVKITKRAKGENPKDLMVEYGLSASTIATIVSNKEKIIAEHQNNENANDKGLNLKKNRVRNSTYKDIEGAVQQWFNEAMDNTNVTIGGNEIKEQAKKYAVFLNHPEFKASNCWLEGFKERNHLKFKSIVGEAGLVDTTTTDNYLTVTLPAVLNIYEPHDIFNADETGS